MNAPHETEDPGLGGAALTNDSSARTAGPSCPLRAANDASAVSATSASVVAPYVTTKGKSRPNAVQGYIVVIELDTEPLPLGINKVSAYDLYVIADTGQRTDKVNSFTQPFVTCFEKPDSDLMAQIR